jgi:uncharacterized protein YfaS (alpha-2-macroglobulin family)
MKLKYIFFPACILLCAVWPAAAQNQYQSQWRVIDSLYQDMSPEAVQQAETLLHHICEETQRENNGPPYVRAVITRLNGRSFREAHAVESIAEIETMLPTAGFPVKNILHSMAADFYWKYYTENRWQILNRTALASAGGDTASDIRTWDLRRIIERCVGHYAASLDHATELQQTGIDEYRIILDSSNGSAIYRPTLYDLLAFRAVAFYRNNESGLVQPAARFALSDPAYFAPAGAFAAMAVPTPDSLSFDYRALALLQKIVAFHLPDANPTAFVDADLQRLDFVYAKTAVPAKDSLYLSALQSLAVRCAGASAAADVLLRMADFYHRQGNDYDPFTNASVQWKQKQAVAIADSIVARFPESLAAQHAVALKTDIERPALRALLDEAVAPDTPVLIHITCRNLPKAYYKIIALDFMEELEQNAYASEKESLSACNRSVAVATGEWSLPDGGDYQQHVVEAALPALRVGYYAVLLASDARFDSATTIITENKIWATRISCVKQETGGKASLLLLDRTTGKPLPGVKAQLYTQDYDYDKRRNVVRFTGHYMSDTGGLVELKPEGRPYRRQRMLFTAGDDSYAGLPVAVFPAPSPSSAELSTAFFTDRAIYRPGQTVFFKGIVLKRMAGTGGTAEIVAQHRQTVTFYNVNGEKVADVEVRTNEYGSFAGSFAIPSAGLTGQMRIAADRSASGNVYFHVEEYRRPKFEVTFDPTDGAYRPGEEVNVSGKAGAYAGAAVAGATVTYRVVREARYPFWRWWWGERPSSPAQEITHGQTVTRADGSFGIAFTAVADETVPNTPSPVFYYKVEASVVDVNGETHDAQTVVPVGYRALLLSADVPDKVNTDTWGKTTVTAANLHGKAVAVRGTLTVWKLRDPARTLQPRRGARPDRFLLSRTQFEALFPFRVYDNEDDPATAEREREMCSIAFDTGDTTACRIPRTAKWPAGRYLMTLAATDAFGEAVEQVILFTAHSQKKNTLPPQQAFWFDLDRTTAQPGEVVNLTVGSAYRDVRAIVEITGRDGIPVERQTVALSGNAQRVAIPVSEAVRGNFGITVFFVKHNRSYMQHEVVRVPFENKRLRWTFASFRDRLQPGQPEEWQITITNNAGDAVAAELLASMYDASLDAFAPHRWTFFPWNERWIPRSWNADESFEADGSDELQFLYRTKSRTPRQYDRLMPFDFSVIYASLSGRIAGLRTRGQANSAPDGLMLAERRAVVEDVAEAESASAKTKTVTGDVAVAAATAPPSAAAPPPLRTNFNETAFFYPQLRTNEAGETVIRFTVPDALTRWSMQGLAWTPDLRVGYTQQTLVTQKELMIFTNPPRFFREGDTLLFSAKLTNLSATPLTVAPRLAFFDALTAQPLTLIIDREPAPDTVAVAAGGQRAVAWKLRIPEGVQAVGYRITATTTAADSALMLSDGEESIIPVLTNRMLVTESLPLPIRGKQTRDYTFTRLLDNRSATLRTHALTLEFTGNPAWNALLALPGIMEYPYDCAEQAFSRYYANTLAAHIANSQPHIRQVFDIWRNYQPSALQSNLEKNDELKALLLEETPWVRDARNDSERRQRLAALFDRNRMHSEQQAALKTLRQAQTPNGGFAWFAGGRDDRYITQHIVAGIGHLHTLNVSAGDTRDLLNAAIQYMDARLADDFSRIRQQAADAKTDYRKENHLDYLTIHYLYARSFFTASDPIPASAGEAFDYFLSQAATHWKSTPNNYLKGMLALALHRYGDKKTAQTIVRALAGTALHDDETGMYWRHEPRGWWWYQAPIETHALLIEAFDEVLHDRQSVEELKVWLLKQKQTQDWKTTKATAEAVYALLVGSGQSPWAASSQQPTLTVGGDTVAPPAVEAGTGYFKTVWHGSDVRPEMARISVENPNAGIAWGAAYWQYFEQLDKITPAATGVGIRKQLFVKANTPAGPVLRVITPDNPLRVGDRLTVRLEITADRDMEYVHLKDMRAAAFEPVNVLSGYRWQGGLGYYESTRDAATHFFISYLPKGVYVFEYDLTATLAGVFSNGITTLQCMYAPEFTTHSEGERLRIEPGN